MFLGSGSALALGVDPPVDDLMARRPRRLNERLIDVRMWRNAVELGLVTAPVSLLTLDIDLPGGLITDNNTGAGDLATARTAGFTVPAFASRFNCLNARSDTASALVRLFALRRHDAVAVP